MFPDGMNTYIGIVVAFAPTLLSWLGYTPTPAFSEEFPQTLSAIITVLGTAYAVYGRARAQASGWIAK